MTTATTSPTREEMQKVLDNGYTPSAVPQLEAYLQLQMKQQAPYHGDAIRSLIKHYLLFPNTCNLNHVAEALLLAAMEFPNHADYIALSYMLPHPASVAGSSSSSSANSNSKQALDLASSATPVIATIKECFAHLEACQFTKFWASYALLEKNDSTTTTTTTTPAIAELARKSVGRMQQAVLHVLSFTYQQAPVTVVLSALNAPEDSIQAIRGLLVRKDSVVDQVNETTVTFIPNVYNTKKQRVYQESLSFAAVTNLMNKINAH